ncbi:MAG: O-antigen ligase family protein [Chloroflexota bacterium]
MRLLRTRSSILPRFLIALLILYSILAGGTFDGILNAQRRTQSVIVLGVVVVTWLAIRWRSKFRWHHTPLDLPILLWVAAFAVSLLANAESWRRIAIGLWYVGLYIGVWYVLQDALANHKLRREWLVDALLIAGVPVGFVGFAQVELALTSGLALPRPVGTLGNANALAGFLVLLLPFAAGRLMLARTPLTRMLLAVYSVAILLLLLLSFSRGGWLGAGVALVVWASLRFPLSKWWGKRRRRYKLALVAAGILIAAGGLLVVVQSFGLGGRGLDLRAWIYETALHMIGERPLTGSGLFTFGAGLARLNSLPPFEPHSHAHNILLNVAAELGIVGVLALVLTAWVILRAALRLRHTPDPIAVMGFAAFAGFAAHQMVDLPAMMPALALFAFIALALFVLPGAEVVRSRARWQPALVAALALLLTATGIWSALQYSSLVAALSDGIGRGDYRAAAERIEALSESDPALAIYPQQAGMLLGLAAADGDADAARAAVEQFRRYTRLEPSYASGWANLAAMYFANGDLTPAADAMRKAVDLAPQSGSLVYRYGVYSEAANDALNARAAYTHLLALNPDAPILPDWDQSPLRREVASGDRTLSPYARAILLLESGDLSDARALWSEGGYVGDYSNVHVVQMIFALADGNHALAEAELQAASRAAADRSARAWVYLGAALLDPANFDAQIASARLALEVAPTAIDWELGQNINYIQYLSLAIPRQFLPQVGYIIDDTALLRLLGSTDGLRALRAALNSGG